MNSRNPENQDGTGSMVTVIQGFTLSHSPQDCGDTVITHGEIQQTSNKIQARIGCDKVGSYKYTNIDI